MVTGLSWRSFCSLVFAIAAFALVTVTAMGARADDVRRAGKVRLTTAGGTRGPVDLVASADGFAGELLIVNDGKEPLVVSRIAVRGDAADPRVPQKLGARVVEGSLPITIAPGSAKKASVTWSPERETRQRQLFGHIVVTTSDEESGEVAMGVRALGRGPLESHVLSLLVLVPILGAVATFIARGSAARDAKVTHTVAVTALAVQLAGAAYVYRGFVPDTSRLDGNDGLQFVEHVVWIRALAAEYFLGVDGIAATALVVTTAVAFLAVLFERSFPRVGSGYHAALLVLDAAVVGAIVAMDGLLFVLFSSIAIVSATVLVGAWGREGRRGAAMRVGVAGFFAVGLLTVATCGAARHADPTFLVDGTRVTSTFSLPELSRVAFAAKDALLFGASLPKVGFALVLVASLSLMAAFPTHRWLADVVTTASPAAAVLVSAALPTLGLCALLRIGCAVFPEGMRWASGIVVALGAISAGFGALSAFGETDLRRVVACATMAHVGFVLLGAGSLTPQGLSGAIVIGTTRAIATSGFLLLAAAIDDRVQATDATRLAGIARRMPGWGIALAILALAQAGVLGLGGAWGPVLSLIGALSSYAPLAIASAIALVLIALAHLGIISRVAFDTPDADGGERAAAWNGNVPDLTSRDWTSVAPLAVLVVLFGLWPAPIVSTTTGTVRDLANLVSPPGPDKVALR